MSAHEEQTTAASEIIDTSEMMKLIFWLDRWKNQSEVGFFP